jgi:uracil-DNA glycosylase family 4
MTNTDISDFKGSELQKIGSEVRECRRCHLSETRLTAAPGEGPSNATVVFIGEGPGRQKDLEGRPFVGRAGKLLDELLGSIKTDRKSVYITNVVKCRPKLNETARSENVRDRRPTSEEIAACTPYLENQLRIIEPQIICTLGDTADQFILEKYRLKAGSISNIHGKIYLIGSLKIIPMHHPAAALYTARLKEEMKRDFKKLAGLLSQTTLPIS